VRLGGYNSPLSLDIADFLGTTTILFGIDISHGPPGDVDSPPIAAVSKFLGLSNYLATF
jgi:eukaryotic translation initiation factor 2C